MRRFFPPSTSNNLKGTGLIFYCKDCEKIVDVIPVGRKFVYKCAICKTKNVAFGTDKSIRNFFHLPEDKSVPAETVEPEAPVVPAIKTEPAVQATAPVVQSAPVEKPASESKPGAESKLAEGPTPIPENK